MTSDEIRNAVKTGIVVVFGVLMLLSVFGPLAQYREWLLLAAGIVSIIGSTMFGIKLETPIAQVKSIQARKASKT